MKNYYHKLIIEINFVAKCWETNLFCTFEMKIEVHN